MNTSIADPIVVELNDAALRRVLLTYVLLQSGSQVFCITSVLASVFLQLGDQLGQRVTSFLRHSMLLSSK